MAIAYSGPRAQSYTLTIDDNGNKKNIYLHTQMANLQPTLKQTNILSLIRNTNANNMFSAYANSRYYYNIKESGELSTIRDETGMVVDPRTLKGTELQVTAKQLAPITRVKMFTGFKDDLKIQGLENVAAIKMADYIAQVRLNDQKDLFTKAINDVALYQQDNLSSFTTFDEGAHFVYNKTIIDGNDAYDHLCEAIDNFQRLGTDFAEQDINKQIPHCNGISPSDMVIIASNSFTTKLKKVPGIFAGPGGNELFMKNGIDLVESVPYIATSQLPKNIHFMIMTTGIHGAIAYEECGDIIQMDLGGKSESIMNFNIVMVNDPNYSGAYRIDFTSVIKKDVIFPELIFISSNYKSLPTDKGQVKSMARSGNYNESDIAKQIAYNQSHLKNLYQNKNDIENNLETLKNNYKQNKDKTILQEISDNQDKVNHINDQIDSLKKLIKNLSKQLKKM